MRVLIAGGGTAGHINPGLAIAKYIKEHMKDVDIVFIGTRRGLESKLVPREGFLLRFIKVRGFKRKISLDTFKGVRDVFIGTYEAGKIIREYKPDLVIGTGGYVCGPVLLMASLLRIPTLIHESNAIPGITNRILGRFMDSVCVGFSDAKKYFKKNVLVTGNPLRDGMIGDYDTTSGDKRVVIFGGSRGARKINETVCKMINKYGKDINFNMMFATGEAWYKDIEAKIEYRNDNIVVLPYIFDMPSKMKSASLLVTRAGAMTLAEITAMGKPSILIPSPYVTANHQEHNARALEKNGASVVILEDNLNEDMLFRNIVSIVNDNDKLYEMSNNSKKIGILDAKDKIFGEIKRICKKVN